MKKILVTGGCGFVGSNLTKALLERGHDVTVFDNMSRHGTVANQTWLQTQGNVTFVQGDTRNPAEINSLISQFHPDTIFHLAGQVAMTTSMKNPRADFEINVLGSLNLLEAVREFCPDAVIVYASSNKVYGNLTGLVLQEAEFRYQAVSHPLGFDETTPLDFQTPYGCSKGAADQYMLDYARVFNLNTVVFRHSTIYGGRQYATFDQGWVGWFCQQAAETLRYPDREPFTISGDGKQVRDLLYVEDAIACYISAAEHYQTVRGHAFNIGGGIENSCSLLELFQILQLELGISLHYRTLDWRHSDQRFFVANPAKALQLFGWKPQTSRLEGIRRMLAWAQQITP